MSENISANYFRRTLFGLCFAISLSGCLDSAVALAIGIALSVLVGNPFAKQTTTWSKILLQISVVGLGFGVGIGKVLHDGQHSIPYTIITITVTVLVGSYLGKIFRVTENTSHLISFGTAICGGSAIAALAPTLKAKQEEVAIALATVFSLNALALLLFPTLGHLLQMTQEEFGLWAALAIHDTSSVVGAASSFGQEALAIAVTVKLTRALWIAPCVLIFAWLLKTEGRAKVPLFILGFIAAACLRTFVPEYLAVYEFIVFSSRHLLIATLFLIGAGLSRSAVQQVGLRPFLQAVALWILVSITTFLAIHGGIIT